MPLQNAFGLFGGKDAPTFDAGKAIADTNANNLQGFKINAAAGQKQGAFGSSQVKYDANGNPIGTVNSFDPSLNAGAFGTNLGLLGGQLPGTTVDFSKTDPSAIYGANMAAYQAGTQPLRDIAQAKLNADLTNRGLPVGGDAWNNAQLPVQMANNAADLQASATAWNAMPGMQATMTNTAIQQGQSPYQLAGLNLGLLTGMLPLTGNANQATYTPADAMGAYTTQYQGELNAWDKQKDSDNAALGMIGNVAGGLLGSGGASTMMNWGKNLVAGGGLFNNASATPSGWPVSGVR